MEPAPGHVPGPFGGLETSQPLSPRQIDAIARDLLAQLTMAEKIGMMSGEPRFWPGLADVASAAFSRRPWVAGAVPRLGIPGVRFTDGPRGCVQPGATTFPCTMARGATWDPALEERVGDAMGREARASGANLIGAVCINLLRHPAWGRAQETYGEDPHHLSEMGAALTSGIQRHIMACAKHYALNSMENARFKVDVTADPRTLHEVYLPHFRRVVEAGIASVMSAYNSVNGAWAGQSRSLLHDILVEEWGFEGFVQTDWIFGMRDAKAGALAGQHLEMPSKNLFDRDLPALVESDEVSGAVVDDAALRILRQQVRFAQGRDRGAYTRDVIGCEAHRALAREVSAKSIVLLKNDGVLPLAGVRRLAVFGRLADLANTGDRGSSQTQPAHVVTPLQGIRASAGADFIVAYDEGTKLDRAARMAQAADAAICVVGYTYRDEGEYVMPPPADVTAIMPPPTAEDLPFAARLQPGGQGGGAMAAGGDRASLRLRDEDEELIRTVAAANPRTVVAVMGGSAVITEPWRGDVGALLMLWYPGMEGGHALADVLLGAVNPCGKLPCSFPRSEDDLPFFDRDAAAITYDLWHGYRLLDRRGTAAAFPFGFGLSYTTFTLAGLRLSAGEIPTTGAVALSCTLTNTGGRAGEEVVQVYVGARSSTVERARRELKAFTKVHLDPGEARTVRLAVAAADTAYYEGGRGWVVEPGEYEVIVGRHAADEEALVGRFRIVGDA